MSAYLQQGHGSWGLLEDGADLGSYSGFVLSPVNDDPGAVANGLKRLKHVRHELEVILDPQLYNPAIDKGKLPEWDYFDAEHETGDHTDPSWWIARGVGIADSAVELEVDAICTPVHFPRHFSDDCYRFCVEVGDATFEYATSQELETLLTAVVDLRDLGKPNRALQLASILSSSRCERLYLTFHCDDRELREPIIEVDELASAVHLVRLLADEMRVHVAFCAHDAILWKAAGASDLSSGKFLNLRRFTPSRWRDEDTGGRQVSYWNDETLGTLLRDQDVLRLDREKWFDGERFRHNPHSASILEILRSKSGAAWQKHSWLQYLRWVSNADARYDSADDAQTDLESWDKNWDRLAKNRIRFLDRFNDGSHVRAWLNALEDGLSR
jgi:hypothetical protein